MKRLISLALLFSLSSPVWADSLDLAKSVDIIKHPAPLESHIKKKYSAYTVEVVNNSADKLKVDSVSIKNGFVGIMAATDTKTSMIHLLWGLPLGLIGIGIAAIIVSHKNDKAEREAMHYSNQVQSTELNKGEKFTFNALVPLGQQPELKIHFTDTVDESSFEKIAILAR
jgi:hypothetical protein